MITSLSMGIKGKSRLVTLAWLLSSGSLMLLIVLVCFITLLDRYMIAPCLWFASCEVVICVWVENVYMLPSDSHPNQASVFIIMPLSLLLPLLLEDLKDFMVVPILQMYMAPFGSHHQGVNDSKVC